MRGVSTASSATSTLSPDLLLLINKSRSNVKGDKIYAVNKISAILDKIPITDELMTLLVENVLNEAIDTIRAKTSEIIVRIEQKHKHSVSRTLIEQLERAEANERSSRYPNEVKIWSICDIISIAKTGKIDLSAAPNSVVAALCGDLNDPDLITKKDAVIAIHNTAKVKPQAIPNSALTSFINNISDLDLDPEIRAFSAAAIRIIAEARPEFITQEAALILASMIKDKNDKVRISAARILKAAAPRISSFITGRNMIAFIENFDSDDAQVANWSGEAFEVLASERPSLYKEAMSILANYLGHEDEKYRLSAIDSIEAAIFSLPSYVTDEVATALVRSLDDSNAEIREIAAKCIEDLRKAREDIAEKKEKASSPSDTAAMNALLRERDHHLEKLERIRSNPALYEYSNTFNRIMTSAVTANHAIGSGMIKDDRKSIIEVATKAVHVLAGASSLPLVQVVTGAVVIGAKIFYDHQRRHGIERMTEAFPTVSSYPYFEAAGRELALRLESVITGMYSDGAHSHLSTEAWNNWFKISKADTNVAKLASCHVASIIYNVVNTREAVVIDREEHVSKLIEWALKHDFNGMKAVNDNAQEHAAKIEAGKQSSNSKVSFLPRLMIGR